MVHEHDNGHDGSHNDQGSKENLQRDVEMCTGIVPWIDVCIRGHGQHDDPNFLNDRQ